MIIRRPRATARSMFSKPCVSTRPAGSKMRILRRCGYSAATRAEIIPHRGDDARNLGFGQRGQGAGKVEPGAFGDAEPRTDGARQGAAHRRRPVERQNPEYAEEQGRTQGFDRMSKSEPTA